MAKILVDNDASPRLEMECDDGQRRWETETRALFGKISSAVFSTLTKLSHTITSLYSMSQPLFESRKDAVTILVMVTPVYG